MSGPASSDPEMISALIGAGMNVARLNMSHGSHEDHTRSFEAIREAAAARGVAVAVLADLQGPKIRVGKIPAPGFDLKTGDTFVLSVDPDAAVEPGRVTVDYPEMAREVKPDAVILKVFRSITDPVVRLVRAITPAVVPNGIVVVFSVAWLMAARMLWFLTAVAFGMRLSSGA